MNVTSVPQIKLNVVVAREPQPGWISRSIEGATLSFSGYLFDDGRTLEREAALEYVSIALGSAADDRVVTEVLAKLGGHFALIIETADRVIATVDRVRSIPVTWAERDGTVHVETCATRLRDKLGLARNGIDEEQSLSVAMSGYTIGAATLYRGIKDLRAGEALVIDRAGIRTLRWFVYDAWRTEPMANPERLVSDLHRLMMERLVKSASGRCICVPLSAGLDSRFIAAGLKAVGYKDVHTFSYGRPGNHEAETAKAIAERLGFPWTFVPFTTQNQRTMFADAEHEHALWETGDAATSVPFEQDWQAIVELKRCGVIPADAIIVNGQSGDYITGNHAPAALIDTPAGESRDARRMRVLTAITKKHYRLWDSLTSPRNDARIQGLLAAEAEAAGASFDDTEALHGIHEMLEYQDRQAKYVVSGQRTYDALGLSWRLPLWDDEYVLFWRRAEASLKRGQNLYRRVLEADNWGGVFQNIPVNAKTITPAWIRPLRFAAKVASAPLGRAKWHQIERRAFNWWMDPLRVSAVVPYSRALKDSRGARHAVAFLVERYLAKHGVSLNEVATQP